jgi:hypothetical protein
MAQSKSAAISSAVDADGGAPASLALGREPQCELKCEAALGALENRSLRNFAPDASRRLTHALPKNGVEKQ